MGKIYGTCPHCGGAVSCGLLDNKQVVLCSHCEKPLFGEIQGLLKLITFLFILPLIPAMVGVALRRTIGVWGCFGLIGVSAALLFLILFLERQVCARKLNPKKKETE